MKNTKGNRALAAQRAMQTLADNETDQEARDGLQFWAGRFSAIQQYSGYLSGQQIFHELRQAQEVTPDFTLAYELEMNK